MKVHQLKLLSKNDNYKKAYNMIPQRWIINCHKMYKISDEVINFIEKTMKTWWVELTAAGKSLTETKIQRGIFQGDALSRLLFITAMMLLNHILRKGTAGYKLTKSQEKKYMANCLPKRKKNWKLISYLPNHSPRAGYDTRSIFKRSLTGLNSELSFS